MGAQIWGMTGVGRRSVTSFSGTVRSALDALDGRISRFGRFGSTAILTAMTAAAVMILHFSVRFVEGLPIQWIATVNLGIEITIVAPQVIFYARDVIAQLKTSRAPGLGEMSRQL